MEKFIKKYKAFTLAETMIVIAVLGIISLITIPSMVKTNFRRTSIIRVKKMYSTMQTALTSMIAMNGYGSINLSNYPSTSTGAEKVYEDFIKPYIRVSFVAGTSQQEKEKIMNCENPMKLLTGGYHTSDYCKSTKYFGVRLNDGSTITMRGYNNDDLYFVYDTNGKKGPNTLGKDIFRFYLTSERTDDFIYPISEDKLHSCAAANNGGWECTQWIITKGNMDYLDCPGNYNWTKNKCN